MWPEIVKRLPRFASAVLTGLDGSGDPVSVRCQPTLDHHAQVLRVAVPERLGIVSGDGAAPRSSGISLGR
jgi:hypothetical protein